MPSQDKDDDSHAARVVAEADVGAVTLTRENELLREIARALAREAAREAFERGLAAAHITERLEAE